MPRQPRIQEYRRNVVRRALMRWARSAIVSANIPLHGIHRILVVRPNHRLGNTLMLTPLLAELEMAYPGAEVDVLCAGPAAAEIFASNRMVRNVWSLPRRIVRHPWFSSTLVRQMRTNPYDLAIDPCIGSHSGRMLLMLSRARYKLGFVGNHLAGGVNCGVAVPEGLEHMAQLPVYLLRKARGETFDLQHCPRLDIGLTAAELGAGRDIVARLAATATADRESMDSDRRPLIGLFGDASGVKHFPDAWWASVIEDLKNQCPRATLIEIVPVSGRSKFGDSLPTYYSTSIRRMAAVMAALDLVVSADCGVMHLAVASGTATAGIFSVTSQKQYGPYGSSNFAISAARRAPWEIAGDLASYLHEPRWTPATSDPFRLM